MEEGLYRGTLPDVEGDADTARDVSCRALDAVKEKLKVMDVSTLLTVQAATVRHLSMRLGTDLEIILQE